MTFDTLIIMQYWPVLAKGLVMTIVIVALAFFTGIILGLLVCSMMLSKNRFMARFAAVYINVFRNIPDMVLIFWIYYCAPSVIGLNLSAIVAGILALSLSSGANLAELFRAGIGSVPAGQTEAAASLGLGRLLIWVKIILPQALTRVLGPIISYLAELLKNSTLLSAIGVAEAAHAAFSLGSQTYRFLEFFSAIGAAFFLLIFPLSVLARRLARRQAVANR